MCLLANIRQHTHTGAHLFTDQPCVHKQVQGQGHAERGEWAGALNCWNTALRHDPDNAILHEEIAQVLLCGD